MSDWKPINTAPRDGTPIDLWCCRSWDPPQLFVRRTDVYWCTTHNRWRTVGNSHYVEDTFHDGGYGSHHLIPTHWMPIPKPPTLTPAKISWSEPDAA